MEAFDFTIVGAGIVGLASAYEYLKRHPEHKVLVIEAEDRWVPHQTGHNSGVIHSGLYYKPHSLKATLTQKGRKALLDFCQRHDIPYRITGKIVAASEAEEIPRLDELQRRGEANGLQGLNRLSPEQAREIEPALQCIDALWVPDTGVVDYKEVARALGKEIQMRGGEIRFHTQWQAAHQSSEHGPWIIQTSKDAFQTQGWMACAGLQSDRVARKAGLETSLKIIPFRGEYYQLKKEKAGLIRALIYPVPSEGFPFLGVHFTKTIRDEVEIGPNAVPALSRHGYRWTAIDWRDLWETWTYAGFWKLGWQYRSMGVREIYRSLSKRAALRAMQKLVPELSLDDLEVGQRGVRAQAVDREGNLIDDFRFRAAQGMLHVLNAPSPAATASLAIAEHLIDQWEKISQ